VQMKTINCSSRTRQAIGEECALNSEQGAPLFGEISQGNITFSSDIPLSRNELLTEHETSWISHYGKCSLEQVWLDLCCDKQEAKAVMIAFLNYYIRTSVEDCLVLGSAEVITIQTVGCTRYILEVWKNLVMEADNTVLRDMRQKHPEEQGKWKLRWEPHRMSRDRPVGDLSTVSLKAIVLFF